MTMKKVFNMYSASDCLREIILSYTKMQKDISEEKTKQKEIKSREKITIVQIKAQRDVLIKYLENSFDERAKNFQFLFNKVDQAILEKDSQQLSLVLNSITEIAKSNPLEILADLNSVKAKLDDPDHEWIL